jgi:hypothetical protein
MDSNRFPFVPSCEIPHAASPLAEAKPILLLERELRRAIERAEHLERRGRAVERELVQARRDLARSKASGREQLRAVRLELLATEARCWALDEVCRALLLTIEHAASSELAEPPLAARASP